MANIELVELQSRFMSNMEAIANAHGSVWAMRFHQEVIHGHHHYLFSFTIVDYSDYKSEMGFVKVY